MKINLVKGARKRESCFYFRRDTVRGVYRTHVCEKTNFKKPSVMRCTGCTAYTPYLSIAELAKREKERYKHFLKKPLVKNCKTCGKTIETSNPDIKKCRTNCNTLLAYVDGNKKNSPKKVVQKKLC